MKFDPQKTAERLKGVPIQNRVFIYNAQIILEFLNQTLMPIQYFLSPAGEKEISGAFEFKPHMLKDPKAIYEHRISIGTLYDYYKMFREQKDYTSPVESRYKFSVILKKLNWNKNGWCFDVRRVGRGQLIFLAPAMLRVKAPKEDREKFPVQVTPLADTPVEVTPEDHNDDDIPVETFVAVDPASPEGDHQVEVTVERKQDGTSEIKNVVEVKADRFKEAKFDYHVDVSEEGEGY